MIKDRITVKKLPAFIDERGELFVGETGKEIPFSASRLFFITNLPEGAERGDHANLSDEFVVCCSGACRILIDDTESAASFELSAGESVFIPGGTWRTFKDFSQGCILAVACPTPYSKDDYITDREKFREYIRNRRTQ